MCRSLANENNKELIERAWYFVVLTLLSWIGIGLCHPVVRNEKTSDTAITLAVDYLTKYGYLQSSEMNAGSLRTEDELRSAIRSMQKFGNIPQTGLVDGDTLRLMSARRCGLPDLIGSFNRLKRYSLQGQKWSRTDLTWSVKNSEGRTPTGIVRGQLVRAFKVWSDASVLTFTEIEGQKSSADIVVSFLHGSHGDGYPFDGEGAVLAHAFFPGEGIGGDAHFDAEEKWLAQQPEFYEEGVNLFAVAAHEIGHSLGLSHSSLPGSLMFPYYQIVDGHFQLPADDANGVRHLYGSKVSISTEHPKNTTVVTRTPVTRKATSTTASTTPEYVSSTTSPITFGNRLTTSSENLTPVKTTVPTKRVETPSQTPTDFEDDPPNACNTTIDAISVIRGEIFLFKEKYFWRLNRNHTLRRGYPARITSFWYNLTNEIDRIDALYERPTDTNIVFFSGKRYWLFSGNEVVEGYPKPLTDLGLPTYVDHIDAALVWGHNKKTYLFSGALYWRLDEKEGKVELDYPRDMKTWRGVPYDLDAAFQWTDGNTYFLKGNKFWKFHDSRMKAHEVPEDLNGFLFGCKTITINERTETTTSIQTPTVLQTYDSSGGSDYRLQCVVTVSCIVIYVIFKRTLKIT